MVEVIMDLHKVMDQDHMDQVRFPIKLNLIQL